MKKCSRWSQKKKEERKKKKCAAEAECNYTPVGACGLNKIPTVKLLTLDNSNKFDCSRLIATLCSYGVSQKKKEMGAEI